MYQNQIGTTQLIMNKLQNKQWLMETKKTIKENVDRESKTRSILKSVSWRLLGTLDTMCLAWILTGSPLIGLQIGGLELFTKMILYYFHERAWLRTTTGIKNPQ